jgi:hypothetical protein
MNDRYFDIDRDNTYPCFCQACLVGKPKEEMSGKDGRFCLQCQSYIETEYALLGRS